MAVVGRGGEEWEGMCSEHGGEGSGGKILTCLKDFLEVPTTDPAAHYASNGGGGVPGARVQAPLQYRSLLLNPTS